MLETKASLVAQIVKNLPPMQETWVQSLGRSTGGGHGNSLQYSCQENPHGQGAWRATVHGVTKSRTQLSDLAHTLEANAAWEVCVIIPGGADKGGE